MKTRISDYFKKPYELRFNDLIFTSLIILLTFRLLTLFEVSKPIHLINIFTFDFLITIFSLVGVILVTFVFYKEEKFQKKNEIIFIILLFHVFFSVLIIIQNMVPNNPITFSASDLLLVLLQFFSFFLFAIFYLGNSLTLSTKNLSMLFLIFSFFSYFLSKLFETSQDISILLLFIANILFWGVLWTIIIAYSRILLNKDHARLLIIGIVLALLLAIGMTMGMTKKEVLTAVISLILNQFFGLFVINGTLPILNFNPEFFLILFNAVTGFIFIAVMVISTIKIKDGDEKLKVASFFLVGLSGLSVLPIFGIFRIFGLSFLFNVHQKSGKRN